MEWEGKSHGLNLACDWKDVAQVDALDMLFFLLEH